jgi:hypothetical protein
MPSLDTFKKWVTMDWRAHASWREGARDDFRFMAGDQWTEEEKQMLLDQNRVPVVFNRVATIINAVAGSEINNRTEIRFIPRTLGDAEVNELLSKGAEWYRDQAGAEEEDSQAFNDTLVCGLGWVETLLDFEVDPEGEPRMERISTLEMCWDASAERRGLLDSRRFARVRQVDREEAKEMYPDADESDLSADWMDKLIDGTEEDPTRQWSDDDYAHAGEDDTITDPEQKKVTIVQLQYRQRKHDVEFIDPLSGQKQVMPKRQFTRLLQQARKMGFEPQIQSRDITRWEWFQVTIGADILDENQPCKVGSTFIPITGYWDQGKKRWFGLLKQMHDPQRFANKWLAQTLHIIDSNSKGGVMAETGVTDDHRKFEEEWAAADSVIWMRDGSLSQKKVQEKPKVEMPVALMSLTEFAITSIRDVSGVNQELLGLRDANQPGVLEYQRKQAAMTTLAVMFDALRQYRKQQGRVLLYYITEFLADGRLVRITDQEGERYEPLVIEGDTQKYDVIVEDAPSAPNNQERVWETIVQMMPMLERAELSAELWAEIIEYSPFPTALVEKLKEFAQKGKEPDPMAQKMIELQVQQAMAEVQEKQAEAKREEANAVENMAQAKKAEAEAALAWARAQAQPDGNTAVEAAQARKLTADAALAYARAQAVPQELQIKRMSKQA